MVEATAVAGPSRSSIPCKWHLQGYCWRGESCWFSHDPSSLSSSASSSSSSTVDSSAPPTTSVQSVRSLTTLATSSNDSEQVCGICLDKPSCFGLLDACAHVFCFECLKEWRKTKGKDSAQAEHAQTCPACRVPSALVTPSSFFLAQGPAKEAAINRYKANMKKKPCMLLLKSPEDKRWCPFGRDCWYSHTLPDGETIEFTHTHADSIEQRTMRRERFEQRREERLAWRQAMLLHDVAAALRQADTDSDDEADSDFGVYNDDHDDEIEEDDTDDSIDLTRYRYRPPVSSSSSWSSSSSAEDSSSSDSSSDVRRPRLRSNGLLGIQDGDSTDTVERHLAQATFEDESSSGSESEVASTGSFVTGGIRYFARDDTYHSRDGEIPISDASVFYYDDGDDEDELEEGEVRESWEDSDDELGTATAYSFGVD